MPLTKAIKTVCVNIPNFICSNFDTLTQKRVFNIKKTEKRMARIAVVISNSYGQLNLEIKDLFLFLEAFKTKEQVLPCGRGIARTLTVESLLGVVRVTRPAGSTCKVSDKRP